MCPKCYEKSDIKIISINTSFIKIANKKLYNYLNQEEFVGFDNEEIRRSSIEYNSFNEYKSVLEEDIKPIKKKTDEMCYKRTRSKLSTTTKAITNLTHKSAYFEYKKTQPDTNDKNNNISSTRQIDFISTFLTDFETVYLHHRNPADPHLKSPHDLIEERLHDDPWALLVATIFLNKTSCSAARPYVFWFLAENPHPLAVLDKYPADLEKYFVSLGLARTRAVQVYRMSHDFLFKKWESPRQLYGIGDYGECAYRMFCLRDFSVEPEDRFLRIYKAWYRRFRENRDS
ncbi:unnamed protein product [Phyllotreta striolata]|uniref:DNA glycosylase n=1 Tax=Phyllotreta striolata TaxID=444603 RepID=A0A9N9T9B8_PHYSR|nr:unnamed protein product [Phyllotreta striolata]